MYESEESTYLYYDSGLSVWLISIFACDAWVNVILNRGEDAADPFSVDCWSINDGTSKYLLLTCTQAPGEWTLAEANDHEHRLPYGGAGIEPFEPHVDDNWRCEVNTDGDLSYKTCPAIELECLEFVSRTVSPTPVSIIFDFQIPNLYVHTNKGQIVAINFDENRYESMVEEEAELFQGRGVIFLDQYTLKASSYRNNHVLKYDVNGNYLGGFAENFEDPTGLLLINRPLPRRCM